MIVAYLQSLMRYSAIDYNLHYVNKLRSINKPVTNC